MGAWAYYSEHDPYAAAWLRNLVRDGHIAPGYVDERDLWDVQPYDLDGFTQHHFCAGIGLWSHALRRAGWDDSRPIWSISMPCQPFSSAGKGLGFADPRHLLPAFYHLVTQCRPGVLCGEQVASKDGYAWLDALSADLEGLDYAFWPVVLPVAGVGGPGERHRIWWVGVDDSPSTRCVGALPDAKGIARDETRLRVPSASSANRLLANALHESESGRGIRGHGEGGGSSDGASRERPPGFRALGALADAAGERRAEPTGRQPIVFADGGARTGRVAYAGCPRSLRQSRAENEPGTVWHEGGAPTSNVVPDGVDDRPRPGPLNGFWRDADWLFCTDGKWRPVEPESRPLAYGLPLGMGTISAGLERLCAVAGVDGDSLKRAKQYRVGALRGYGNAISPEPAIAFIESWRDVAP